ncbi:methionine adenosyltransferase [Mycoplasma sp. M5725]|uniref:Methionine adenosyltransferase n=1 Tax=Mycoplasma phocimorsus TaxID=3045839 RepID=A0AAJ1UVH4_9MOLU|nr:methionine adenosyltransferase [Mycoplasma phocimorsus]MDJ1645494.1 methionine adenosyltransferase [Mycoplasma phocimorsus]
MNKLNNKILFTSESVGKGHPDKICDQISDRILDKVLKKDKNSRVAIETMASNRLIVIGGELTTTAYVDVIKAAWEVLFGIGYTENDFTIISNVNSQSLDINQGVDKENGELGAGDQGIMFGYATNETANYMPLAISLAHEILKMITKIRESLLNSNKELNELELVLASTSKLFDMKSQVTIDYTNENPLLDTILISMQHRENTDIFLLKKAIKQLVLFPLTKKYKLNNDFKFLFNPTGKFVIGGPFGDTGLTGRKIIVDTYGGSAHHGGGAFSGKDYTKVDRSAAYAARYVAKNIVAANIASEIEIQLSYAIGVSQPVSISIIKIKDSKYSKIEIIQMINQLFDLSPSGIVEKLNLKNVEYYKTSYFGHFGKEGENFTWEKLDMVDQIKEYFEGKE